MGKKKKSNSNNRPISTESRPSQKVSGAASAANSASNSKGQTASDDGNKVPKKYAFDTRKGAASIADPNDKAVQKVTLPAAEERVIIDEILKFKEDNFSSSNVSGRLTNKKLVDLYNSLEDVGFKHSQICDAMKHTVSYGGDLHSALDWLCLNLSDDQLPSGFSEKYTQDETKEEKKKKAKFEGEGKQDARRAGGAKVERKEVTEPSVPKKQSRSSDADISSKEWTLRRFAEQNSDDDSVGPSGNGFGDDDDQPDSWRREPNEYYKELCGLLRDAQEQASEAKQCGDKKTKKRVSAKIQEYVRVMAEVEEHPLFDPKVKSANKPQQQQEKKKVKNSSPESSERTPQNAGPSSSDVLDGDDDGGGAFALFDAMEAEAATAPPPPAKEAAKKKEAAAPPDVRDFTYTKQVWTGKSPKQFLINWCRKHFPKAGPPKYQKMQAHGNLWRCKLTVERSKQDPLVVRTEILTENSTDAQHLASVHAFWHLAKGQSIHQLLPQPYRAVWQEWMDAEAKEKEETTERKNKPRDTFVSQLLKQIKSAQTKSKDADTQQGEKKGGRDKDDEGDEEAESWEDAFPDSDEEEFQPEPELVTAKSERKAQPSVSSQALRTILEKNQNTKRYWQLLKTRKTLPVFQHRAEVMERLEKDSILIVAGETGSGKSTQIPQFLLEELIHSGRGGDGYIVCTQPRRISATSLAKRVSQELGEQGPGRRDSLCGYQIRMESKQTRTTRLLYCTTGVLLRKLQLDPSLKDISHIIIDEVHERSVESDFLMLIVKRLVRQRSDLKLVLMSATLDSQKLSAYFFHCPIVSIPGRTFPVKVYHLEDVVEDTQYTLDSDSRYALRYESLAQEDRTTVSVTGQAGESKKMELSWATNDVANLDESGLDADVYSKKTRQVITRLNPDIINMDLIVELLHHLETPQFQSIEGAVLIFMPGLAQIQQLYELLQSDQKFSKSESYLVIALHSVLSSDDQSAAFEIPPPGVRKIVIATNIAETGITIPDVVFVIDAGRVKENRYSERSQMSSLEEMYVSKASARQRQGRAGRVREGFCFRLYTRRRYEALRSFTQPEIQRVALEELCLHIMKCSLGCPEAFLQEALDPPLVHAIRASMALLREVGACLQETPTLTPLGQHLAALPVNVRIGKMLIFAAIFGCLEPVAVIAAAITDKPPYLVPMGKRGQADAARMAMAAASSDHITIYRAYSGWKTAQAKGRTAASTYCRNNFLSITALLNIENVKRDLIQMVRSIGFYVTSKQSASSSSSASAQGRSLQTRMEVLDISKTDSLAGYKDAFPLTPANTLLLKAVLTAGLYSNVAKTTFEPKPDAAQSENKVCRAETTKGPVTVHPSSINKWLAANGWIIFSERVKLSKVYIRDTTLVSPYPLLLFGGDIEVHHREGLISMDDWIQFQASAKTAVIFKELRVLLNVFLENKLANPMLQIQDEKVILALLALLKTEKTR